MYIIRLREERSKELTVKRLGKDRKCVDKEEETKSACTMCFFVSSVWCI
jgi:hypothetical protein